MHRDRVDYLSPALAEVSSTGLYGSSRASTFLRDVINGTDSVDIITFGDSNTGSDSLFGYTYGWIEALNSFGANLYSTGLFSTSTEDTTNSRANCMFGPMTFSNWTSRNVATGTQGTINARTLAEAEALGNTDAIAFAEYMGNGSSNTVLTGTIVAATATTVDLPASASSVDNFYTNMYIIETPNNTNSEQRRIISYDGTLKRATVSSAFNSIPAASAVFIIVKAGIKPYGFTYSPFFVPSGGTFASPANGPSVRVLGGNSLVGGNGGGGVLCNYRVVYGTFATTGGNFKASALKGTNTVVTASTSQPTSGGLGYNTLSLPFTSSNTAGVADEMKCCFDGYNVVGNSITGPAVFLWHSISRQNTKGFAVQNLNYNGGASTTEITTQLVEMKKYLEAYLKELRLRQIASGGSGRVLWWHNTGINTPETSTSWITNVETIRDTVYTAWTVALGYPADDLAFIFSVTHPVVNGDPGAGAWATNRPAIAQAANVWGATSTNISKNVTVLDLESLYTAAQLKANNMYQKLSNTVYAAHLNSATYTTTSVTWLDTTMNGYFYQPATTSNNGYLRMIGSAIARLIRYT